mmetsp:Transcript_12083/g.34984  ORF Transcript_12083/g.34984 Transcript_12083/m.34984 type:complete len:497 (-) Transcript_12083:23-1513(-)
MKHDETKRPTRRCGAKGAMLTLSLCAIISLISTSRVLHSLRSSSSSSSSSSSAPVSMPASIDQNLADERKGSRITQALAANEASATEAIAIDGVDGNVNGVDGVSNASVATTAATATNNMDATSDQSVARVTATVTATAATRLPSDNNLPEAKENIAVPKVAWLEPSIVDLPDWPDPSIIQNLAINDTVIVLIVTCPYLSFLENSIASMEVHGFNNYVIVPLDRPASDAIHAVWPNNSVTVPPFPPQRRFDLKMKKPAKYNTKPFQELTSSRAIILRAFLEASLRMTSAPNARGGAVSIFYCDVDTYWQSPNALNVFRDLALPPAAAAQPSSTRRQHDMVAIVDSNEVEDGKICSGLLYLRPSDGTLWFLSIWDAWIRTNRFKNDQLAIYKAYEQVLSMKKHNHRDDDAGDDNDDGDAKQQPETSFHVHLLPPYNPQFPVGNVFFEKMSAQQRNQTLIVHNNFIRGAERKRGRFHNFGLWIAQGKTDQYGGRCGSA